MASHPDDREGFESPAGTPVEEVMRSLAAAASALSSDARNLRAPVVGTSSGGSKNKGHKEERTKMAAKANRLGDLRRRKPMTSRETFTASPYYDGHQWRKYGQKKILGSEFPRSYFRCTNWKEQECPATKQIQQIEDRDDAPFYLVKYFKEHTCTSSTILSGNAQVLMGSTAIPGERSWATSDTSSRPVFSATTNRKQDGEGETTDCLIGYHHPSPPFEPIATEAAKERLPMEIGDPGITYSSEYSTSSYDSSDMEWISYFDENGP